MRTVNNLLLATLASVGAIGSVLLFGDFIRIALRIGFSELNWERSLPHLLGIALMIFFATAGIRGVNTSINESEEMVEVVPTRKKILLFSVGALLGGLVLLALLNFLL